MKLVRGEFFENGIKVPLEFGNKDQLALINKAEQLREGVFYPHDSIECLCGHTVWREEGKKHGVCTTCYLKFEWYYKDTSDEFDIPCIRLAN